MTGKHWGRLEIGDTNRMAREKGLRVHLSDAGACLDSPMQCARTASATRPRTWQPPFSPAVRKAPVSNFSYNAAGFLLSARGLKECGSTGTPRAPLPSSPLAALGMMSWRQCRFLPRAFVNGSSDKARRSVWCPFIAMTRWARAISGWARGPAGSTQPMPVPRTASPCLSWTNAQSSKLCSLQEATMSWNSSHPFSA